MVFIELTWFHMNIHLIPLKDCQDLLVDDEKQFCIVAYNYINTFLVIVSQI